MFINMVVCKSRCKRPKKLELNADTEYEKQLWVYCSTRVPDFEDAQEKLVEIIYSMAAMFTAWILA